MVATGQLPRLRTTQTKSRHRCCRLQLRPEYGLTVPTEHLARRLIERGLRQPDWATIEFVVLPAVLEFLVDPPTDTDSQVVGHHSHVAEIEEGMQVRSQQEPVGDLVAANKVVRLDVRGLQHRQRPLSRHDASTVICVRDHDAERALAKPRANEKWAAVRCHRAVTGRMREIHDWLRGSNYGQGIQDPLPEALALTDLSVVCLAARA